MVLRIQHGDFVFEAGKDFVFCVVCQYNLECRNAAAHLAGDKHFKNQRKSVANSLQTKLDKAHDAMCGSADIDLNAMD